MVARAAGGVGRAEERLARPGGVAGAALRIAKGQEQLGLLGDPRVPAQLEGLQRPLVQLGGLLVGHQPRRTLRRAHRIVHRLVELLRLEEVVRELVEVVVEALGIELLDRASNPPVQPGALRHAELLVQGLAHERMREPEPPDGLRDLEDEPRRRGLVDQLEQAAARELVSVLGHLGRHLVVDRAAEQVDLELASDHRRRREHEVALLG